MGFNFFWEEYMGCLESCVVKRVLLHDVASLNGFFFGWGTLCGKLFLFFGGIFGVRISVGFWE